VRSCSLSAYLRPFLIVAAVTGRRLNATRQRRWNDIDLRKGEILWRADSDKMELEALDDSPTDSLSRALEERIARRRNGSFRLLSTEP
jgi:integrase